MKKHYPIEISEELSGTVYYPAEKSSFLPVNKIAFGTFSVNADCRPQSGAKSVITISKDIAQALKIPNLKVPLHLFLHDQTLYLGPLVGIFTSGFTPFPVRPIGERTIFFSKLLSVRKLVGAHAFVFGEEHINWQDGTIQGLFYHKNGWESLEVPFPNVIYDRLPNRRTERKTELINIKKRLQSEYLIPWYNPGFFNKLDIYEKLHQSDACEKYLPETQEFVSFSTIERMLSGYGHVFIKPKNGSLGLGIHQIIYDKEQGNYYCRYRDSNDKNRLQRYSSLESLAAHVFRNRNLSNMLVQQGIHLLRIDKRTVDFRIHTNKDELGRWRVTAIAAKAAGHGSVTTHVKSGGVIMTISELFPSKAEQQEVIHKLTEASLILSNALEDHIEGIIGEIGFDMGIDRSGHVWLFEANSKPGRSIFKHPHLYEFDLLTRKLSLAFSVFLTERAITQPGEMFR